MPPLRGMTNKKVIAAIRPEDIRIYKEAQRDSVSGEIYAILPAGAEVILQVKRGI